MRPLFPEFLDLIEPELAPELLRDLRNARSRARPRAKKEGSLSGFLSFAELRTLFHSQEGRCKICDLPITSETRPANMQTRPSAASLDQIEYRLGHISGNLR
jgi:hypothetical protein